jgi:hypothetical protein
MLALVTCLACGNVPAGDELAPHLVATVMTESAGDPRALPAGRETATSAGDAIDPSEACAGLLPEEGDHAFAAAIAAHLNLTRPGQ